MNSGKIMSEFIQKDVIKKEASVFETFSFLWIFTKGHRLKFSVFCAILFVGGMLGALAKARFGALIEKLINPSSLLRFEDYFSIAAYEILAIIIVFVGTRGLSNTALHAIFNLREHLFQHMKQLPLSYYDREPAGRIVTRLTHDVDTLESFYSGTLARLVRVFLTATTVILVMLQVTWWLGATAAFLTLPSIFLVWSFRKHSYNLYRKYSRTNSSITARLAEYLNGMSVIRCFGLENWSKEKYEERVNDFALASSEINWFNSWMRAGTLFLTHLPTIFLFSVGSFLFVKEILPLGILITYIRLSDNLARPAGALMMEIHQIQTAMSSTERLTTFLSEEKESFETLPSDYEKIKGQIEFQNVSMKYSTHLPWILKNFNLALNVGEKIGIMGRTGSGKSTLISLVTGLYPYQEGKIKIDQRPLEDYDLGFLRSQIAFVSQNTYLMPGTIRDNLTLGNSFEDKEIEFACKQTGLFDLLFLNNRNLDSYVQSQGSNFSQGEAQLFALTRALLQNPSILVLDEATANLDSHLEEKVQKAVEKVCEGRTSLFIAHRLSTLTRCERVLILQDGKLIKEVTGKDLINPSSEILAHLESSESNGLKLPEEPVRS
jgi:ATP-binding cassette subfamily B multidrug efflux pump